MDARNDSGISAVKRERYLIWRPWQQKGRKSQQGGTADNSKHTELFHDRSPTSKGTFLGTKAPMFKNQIGARGCKSRAPSRPASGHERKFRDPGGKPCHSAEGVRIKFWIARAMPGGLLIDAIPGPVTWYTMTYTCGPSDGRLADFPFQGPRFNPSIRHCQQFGNTVTCTGN